MLETPRVIRHAPVQVDPGAPFPPSPSQCADVVDTEAPANFIVKSFSTLIEAGTNQVHDE